MQILLILGALCLPIHGFLIQQGSNQLYEKGDNITDQMVKQISGIIGNATHKCTNFSDYSCFSQVVSLGVEAEYGKSWNVHVFNNQTFNVKGSQYSNGLWLSFVQQGAQNKLAYYIYKPKICAKLLNFTLIQPQQDGKEYWGAKMSDTLKERVKNLIKQAGAKYPTIQQNADYIKAKMGPGKWEVVIWDSNSMDYIDACIYESYFGILLSVDAGEHNWSYYVGRMSLF